MFRIRQIFDNTNPIDDFAISQIQQILRVQIKGLKEKEINGLAKKLKNPFVYRFRYILFAADDNKGRINGFALVAHEPGLNFFFLDFLSAHQRLSGRGVGAALYERVRQEALAANAIGIFFECLPDDPKLSPDPKIQKQNIKRLHFYERFGARPLINTKYEMPVNPGEIDPPYLIYDNLGSDFQLSKSLARKVIKTILERKYGNLCPQKYIKMVIDSVKDNPVRMREYIYHKKQPLEINAIQIPEDKKIILIINDKHHIHHIRERGYVEAPVRIKSIAGEINKTGLFSNINPKRFSEKYLTLVHDPAYVQYLKKVCAFVETKNSIYPYVFPIRNAARPPKYLPVRAGYFCIDTFTPLNHNAYLAAKAAVDCALTGAEKILSGNRLVYVLVRPPSHHAEYKSFGGFCYLNSNAIAAQYLSQKGKICILDIDYHHGNGQQNIFYKRPDVFTISLHGHPRFAYPYFSGFEEETGEDAGKGYNKNYALPEKIDGAEYLEVLKKACKKIERFQPKFLIVALGLDTAKGDPTGTWHLKASDFFRNGKLIGGLKLPTLIIQEGGYNNRNLGINARNFFRGLWEGSFGEFTGKRNFKP